ILGQYIGWDSVLNSPKVLDSINASDPAMAGPQHQYGLEAKPYVQPLVPMSSICPVVGCYLVGRAVLVLLHAVFEYGVYVTVYNCVPVASEESSKATAPRKPSLHPPTIEMVKEALMELDSRKGVSAQAIRTFIREKHPTVDETRVKFMVRKALIKGLESGTFVRPANSNTTGAQGRFRLAVRKPKDAKPPKKTKEAKENANPNVGKAKAKDAGAEKAKPGKKKPAADGDKPKKLKKDASASKVAPAKKPKAKKVDGEEEPEPKAQKTTKTSKSEGAEPGKTTTKKGGKKAAQKAEEGGDEGAEAAAPPKKGKKAAQKTEDGEKKVMDGGEDGGTTAPKASGRKGKKAAEK
ncbi:hypothetical protein NFI96_021569, partial [Prochilodus magdalenae]